MNTIKLKEAINSCDNTYDDLYKKINILDNNNKFSDLYYKELIYICLYIYHKEYGIDKLSKNGNIPVLFTKVNSYKDFKNKLEEYKKIEFHNDLLPDITNIYEEILRLGKSKIEDCDFHWTRIYSTNIYNKEIDIDGKIYISVDNKDLYKFACIFLAECLSSGINDYEFKLNNEDTINRTDNVVIYFTYENINKYLDVIEKIKLEYPNIQLNQSQMLGEEVSKGVAIGRDYKDGSSFTEKACKTIIELKKNGYSTDDIVSLVNEAISNHLKPVMSKLHNNTVDEITYNTTIKR